MRERLRTMVIYTYDTNFVVMRKLMDESKEIVESDYSSRMERVLLKELQQKNKQLWGLLTVFSTT